MAKEYISGGAAFQIQRTKTAASHPARRRHFAVLTPLHPKSSGFSGFRLGMVGGESAE